MNILPPHTYTSFDGHRRIATGPLEQVALAVKRALENDAAGPVLIFDDASGSSIDIDTSGTDEEVLARHTRDERHADLSPAAGAAPSAGAVTSSHADVASTGPTATAEARRGRGRPSLGVVSREVTLLPRHWEWLEAQSGSVSVSLRKLVEEARLAHTGSDRIRQAQERAYHFMSAMAGDLPNFEEATRALFANDQISFSELIAAWPADLREHATALAIGNEPPVFPVMG